jgi:hypothetical protein
VPKGDKMGGALLVTAPALALPSKKGNAMATLCNRRSQVKPRPVTGGCRWVGPPMVVGYRPGRLSITSHTRRGPVSATYLIYSLHARDGRLVGYRMTREDTGEVYDLDADLDLDYLQRATLRVKHGLPADCKHSAALRAALKKCPILI